MYRINSGFSRSSVYSRMNSSRQSSHMMMSLGSRSTPWTIVMKKIVPAIAISQKFKEAGEKSRRKSFSNPENIENFSDKDKNARLEEHMKLQHLEQLMQAFQSFEPPDIIIQEATKFFPAKVQKRTPGAMNITEFKATVNKVIGTNEYDEYLEKLFQKLDTACIGYVDWNEFCTYMLLLYRENDYMRTKREIPFLAEPKIRHIIHNKQEQTTKIVTSTNPCRYVTVSKEGAMSVWYPSMSFEKSFTTSEDDGDQGGPKRRFKMWVTDAVYMPNCNKLALASTSRDIRFFDCSTNQWFEEYHLFAMSDVPYCFDYWYDKKHPNSKSVLVFGVDTGAIHILYFHKPVSQLFETAFKSEGGAQKIFWKEIEKEGSHVRYVEHEKILHDKVQQVPPNQIRQVLYIPDKNCIISSSSTSSRSVVISDIHKLKKQYVFNIEKGIECFDYNKNQNILATGGLDHIVRLWNAYVTNKPIATLEGHATGVIGIKIHEGLMQVFSYSKDAVVKVWDIREHTCLQSVVLKFPSSIHGRMPEHGQFPMHLQPSPHDALLVTCNDYVGMLKLGRTSIPQQQGVITHETQLCGAIYNPLFKQVVTGCDSSHIAVWEIESGNKSIVFSNAHGDEEITAMVFDESYRRLITGARNGTIKVWNFQNGHNLHKLEAVKEAEVTGIIPLTEKQVILAVGWSRKIVQYNDSDPDNMYIPANTNWKGGQIHEDDILSMDYCLPYYLATAGFDGEITVWDIETEKIIIRLRKGQQSDIAKKIESIHESHTFLSSQSSGSVADVNDSRPRSSAQSSRPNSRHRKSHKVQKGQPVPVDKLLFLRKRCTERFVESAMLISSEAGYLRWWNLFAVKHELGLFYVPDNKDESVLALCTNKDNSILISGDTVGFIKVWDITLYCTQLTERRVRDRPPLMSSWKAHDSAVVSVELIDQDTGQYLVSASTDKTARLWTVEGHFIGTFGQKKSWNLKNKKTWIHPRTPWTQQHTANHPAASQTSVNNGHTEKTQHEEIRTNGLTGEVNGTAEDKDKDSKIEEEFQKELNKSVETPQVVAEVVVAEKQKNVGDGDFGVLHKDMKIRSQTLDLGSLRPQRSQTFLGSKVANQLQQMKSCRIDRRKRLTEDIDFNITQRYGKLCSPFQALKTKEVVDVRIPNTLPLSQRMINKGYRSETMTEETLKNMDFSYGGLDSPPSGEQDRKLITGAGKQEKASTVAPKKSRQISAIKKTHTVA